MAVFEIALQRTLRNEGGQTIDQGGLTKYGISQKAFPNLDIKSLTPEAAGEIYHRHYWIPIRGARIVEQELADTLFDFAVNAGVSQAVRTLQKLMNRLSIEKVTVDGVMGPQTLQKLNDWGFWLVHDFNVERQRYYERLGAKPKWRKSLKGWLNRIFRYIKTSKEVHHE